MRGLFKIKWIIDSDMNFHSHSGRVIADRGSALFALKHACSAPQGPRWRPRQWRNSNEHRLNPVPPPKPLHPYVYDKMSSTCSDFYFPFPRRHRSDLQQHVICRYWNFLKMYREKKKNDMNYKSNEKIWNCVFYPIKKKDLLSWNAWTPLIPPIYSGSWNTSEYTLSN